jgi:hypothetical protein
MNDDMTWTMLLVPDVETCCQPDVCLLGHTTRCFAFSLNRSRRHTVESFRDKLVIFGDVQFVEHELNVSYTLLIEDEAADLGLGLYIYLFMSSNNSKSLISVWQDVGYRGILTSSLALPILSHAFLAFALVVSLPLAPALLILPTIFSLLSFAESSSSSSSSSSLSSTCSWWA